MKEQIVISAEPRAARGSSAAGRARRSGRLPAVVYGEGKAALPVEVDMREFDRMLQRHHGEHMILDLVIGGDTQKVLLQELQRDALSGQLLHVDFREVSMTKKLRVEVPLVLLGTPVGVAQQGGILDHLLREVEIECLPGDIPEQIDVDVSGLDLGQHRSVRDVPLDPDRYTMITAPDIAIAAVSAPRIEEEAPAAAAETAAEGEPEVLKEKKPEDAAGEGAKDEKTKGAREKSEK